MKQNSNARPYIVSRSMEVHRSSLEALLTYKCINYDILNVTEWYVEKDSLKMKRLIVKATNKNIQRQEL